MGKTPPKLTSEKYQKLLHKKEIIREYERNKDKKTLEELIEILAELTDKPVEEIGEMTLQQVVDLGDQTVKRLKKTYLPQNNDPLATFKKKRTR